MYCSNCGTLNEDGERFCKNCGTLLNEDNGPRPSYLKVQNNMPNNASVNNIPRNNISNNRNNIINSSPFEPTKQNKTMSNINIWCILTILSSILGIIIIFVFQYAYYISMLCAGLGFLSSEKCNDSNKTFSIIGKILNGVLVAVATVINFMVQYNH